MSVAVARAATGLPDHAVAGADPSVLDEIRRPGLNLALWERALPASMVQALVACDLAGLKPLRLLGEPAQVEDAVAAACEELGNRDLATGLGADAGLLTRLFADATGADQVECRLERVETNACHRFHADYVRFRLLTSYRGEGTEWLDDDEAISLAGGGSAPAKPRQLAPGHVGLFKGRLASETPIVHRSPPILGTGADRLLLVISTPADHDAAFG